LRRLRTNQGTLDTTAPPMLDTTPCVWAAARPAHWPRSS